MPRRSHCGRSPRWPWPRRRPARSPLRAAAPARLPPLALSLALAVAPVDEEAGVKAADAAMSAASQRRDLGAFLGFVADDAVFGSGGGLAIGKAAVRSE